MAAPNTNIEDEQLNAEQQEVLRSVSLGRIAIPILIGLSVVAVLLYRQFDPTAFAKIEWSVRTLWWVLAAFGLLVARHLAHAARLYFITQGAFSFWKCIELIFIFEFSTAITPTQVGGAAVALIVLSQEKLSAGKTASVVIFKVVLDTMFFIITLPLLYLFYGPIIIRPGLVELSHLDSWGYIFMVSYIGMLVYGSLFMYGLFFNPQGAKHFLMLFTKPSFMERYRQKAEKLGNDFILSSKEIKQQGWPLIAKAFASTFSAWMFKFMLMSCLIVAFVPNTSLHPANQLLLFARLEAMFVIMAFSPTPGGAGFAEFVFDGFLSDFVTISGMSILIAFVWRLMAYYLYLFAGAVIIPNWIKNLILRRKLG